MLRQVAIGAIVTILLAFIAQKYLLQFWLPHTANTNRERLFTEEELKQYDGGPQSRGLHLSILGQVFDVEKGRKFYAPGGSYNGFAGRDASRAFITGDFSAAGLRDDVLDLDFQDFQSLKKWVETYRKDYTYKGKLIGRYYDNTGRATEYNEKVERAFEAAAKQMTSDEAMRKKFPPCNSEWKEGDGGRVWCSTKSGGIQRSWVGYPRQFYNQATGSTRCACIPQESLDQPTLKQYQGCAPNSQSCTIPS